MTAIRWQPCKRTSSRNAQYPQTAKAAQWLFVYAGHKNTLKPRTAFIMQAQPATRNPQPATCNPQPANLLLFECLLGEKLMKKPLRPTAPLASVVFAALLASSVAYAQDATGAARERGRV